MNKKANIDDVSIGVTILLSIVITLFIMFTVMSQFEINFASNELINQSTEAMDFIETYNDRYVQGWDYGVLVLALVLPLFSFMAAKRIETKPIYMIMVFFVMIFILLACMIGSNIYGGFMDNTLFQTFVAQTIFIPIIMPNLLYWGMGYVALIIYGLYTKD